MDANTREKFWTDNLALKSADWLPPADVWPELAELRAEHERLLAVVSQEGRAAWEIEKRYEEEDAARDEALREAFRTGKDAGADTREAEEERRTALADALLAAGAAQDALIAFLREAMAEIQEKAPAWYELLESRRAEAQAKREEAERLVAEANRLVSEATRLRNWLDRETGVSALGHYPFAQMGIPALPEYEPAHLGVPGPVVDELVDEPEPIEAA